MVLMWCCSGYLFISSKRRSHSATLFPCPVQPYNCTNETKPGSFSYVFVTGQNRGRSWQHYQYSWKKDRTSSLTFTTERPTKKTSEQEKLSLSHTTTRVTGFSEAILQKSATTHDHWVTLPLAAPFLRKRWSRTEMVDGNHIAFSFYCQLITIALLSNYIV